MLLLSHDHSVAELLFWGRDDRGSTPSLHLCHVPGVMSQIMTVDSSTEIISITSHLNIFDVCTKLIESKIILSARDCPKRYRKHLVVQEIQLVVSKSSKQRFVCAFTSRTCDYGHSQLEDDADDYPRSSGVQMNDRAIPI